MVELRCLVPSSTFVPGGEWPKLQYRIHQPVVEVGETLCLGRWTEWRDVPLVVFDGTKENTDA
jgi:hypothetical protein